LGEAEDSVSFAPISALPPVGLGTAEQAGCPVVSEVDGTPEVILSRGEQFPSNRTVGTHSACPHNRSFVMEIANF